MLKQATMPIIDADSISVVLEHSITWEDDVWRADPFDVVEVHAEARARYRDLIGQIAAGRRVASRMLLFHGQSGAGKTHLVRALRTYTHENELGYFGYAQMTPDVANYADYFLGRLVRSLEKPYGPNQRSGENGLQRLSRRLVEDAATIDEASLEMLREHDLSDRDLARVVSEIANEVIVSERFADRELDLNVVRALLYLQRQDPRIDQRIRQYLFGRQLNEFSHGCVRALDQNEGEDRAFEIIESLGLIMAVVDDAALVFCIDQVEDLRFHDDAEERFKRAVRDLIQIANRVPTSIILISCLGAFYEQVREHLPASYIDRIEKTTPLLLSEARTAEEARRIIDARLAAAEIDEGEGPLTGFGLFGAGFFEEIAGLSTRRVLEASLMKWREMMGEPVEPSSFPEPGVQPAAGSLQERWERFLLDFTLDPSLEDETIRDIVANACRLAAVEDPTFVVQVEPLPMIEGVGALDLVVATPGAPGARSRLYVCNRTAQGGAFKRQIEKVIETADGGATLVLRTSGFPSQSKGATANILRQLQMIGGQRLQLQMFELERMAAIVAFEAQTRREPGFEAWLRTTHVLRELDGLASILDGRAGPARGIGFVPPSVKPAGSMPPHADRGQVAVPVAPPSVHVNSVQPAARVPVASVPTITARPLTTTSRDNWSGDYVEGPWSRADGTLPPLPLPGAPVRPLMPLAGGAGGPVPTAPVTHPPVIDATPSAFLDDEPSEAEMNLGMEMPGNFTDSFSIGRLLTDETRQVLLSKSILKRHAAVLGGSGSGKTTLALSVVEQLLLSGVPVILVDRKGDLCSYANPDVWRSHEGDDDLSVRQREELGSMIDVAVYTPGRTSGRPIGITLLPNGIGELLEHEQQELANVSAHALSEMLYLGNSPTHQRHRGVLAVALKVLGSRATREVTLAELIAMLEDDDEELVEQTQRMDPSGRLRRDLIAQLDALRHRNWALFEGGGEPLSMESMLGIGRYARPGRTRLSVVYTGFLGDNENILFWVSQFLSEALRFCQRNPNEELQAVIMFDEADLYIPANARPATSEPLQSLLKRARSAGVGILLATQSPGDLDYRSRDQITSWFIGRVREETALRKLRGAFGAESGIDPIRVLPNQTVGEFHLIQEAAVRPMKSRMSLIRAEQVPFERVEQLARETKGHDAKQLRLDI